MRGARRAAGERGLAPDELGVAAVMGGLCVGLTVFASVIPQFGLVQAFTVVPFGVVAHRHRLRAVITTFVAAAVIASLVSGIGSSVLLAMCAFVGTVVGELKRRGYGIRAVWVVCAVAAPAAAGLADLLLLVFAAYRKLVLKNVHTEARGLTRLVGRFTGHPAQLRHLGHDFMHTVNQATAHWPLLVAAAVMLTTTAAIHASWTLIGQVLDRLRWVGSDELPLAALSREAADAPVAPLPVRLRGVSVSYDEHPALSGLDLSLTPGQLVAVVGDNGSGKSTLARLLAGAEPTEGQIERAGAVGLGRAGGTAVITQRPDAQVVGLRVADDVVWGLPAGHDVDASALLQTVGLGGLEQQNTNSLSGGQLQRLAVAAALARRPALLISDESTAMVDPDGRRRLVELYAALPRERPMTVVHITHHEDEIAAADRVIRLEAGRVVADGPPAEVLRPSPPLPDPSAAVLQPPERPEPPPGQVRPPRLWLHRVGHEYGYHTVWAHRALAGVDLQVSAGEGVRVVGENGSGKSTLAWIIAGLLRPTEGKCQVDRKPSHRAPSVGIAFQHARLQLQRPTVGAEIADAAGWQRRDGAGPEQFDGLPGELDGRTAAALRSVGLGPEFARRSIEQLSGGQQRRVALAGLLARSPAVLVLDEPLAGLDLPSRHSLLALLAQLRDRDGMTLVVVTHDPDAVAAVCPRLVRLDRGQLVADSAPEPAIEVSAA